MPFVSVRVPIKVAPLESVIIPVVVISPVKLLALIVIKLPDKLNADDAVASIVTL